MTRVAVVGLGRMGGPMARNIAKAGFDLAVYDADPMAASRLAAELAVKQLASPSDFANVDVVITMLPTSTIVSHVLFDWEGGIVAAMQRPSATVVDMSSSDPVHTVESARRAAEAGVDFVDAPVSGGVSKAENGTLTVMLGGGDEAVERVAPVIQSMSDVVVRTGPIGSAHAMKALNNVVAGATTMACFEALAAGGKFGIDPQTMVDIWNQSTARSFVTSVVMEHNVVTGTFDSGFTLPLYAKDVGVAESIFSATGIDAPVSASVAQAFRSALADLGDVDHTRVAELIAGRSAVTTGPPRSRTEPS